MKDIQKFCKYAGITEDQFYGREKIGDSLYLSGLTSIPEGFNPTVGGSLDLRNSKKYIGATGNIPHIPIPDVYFWRDKKYIKADGIFTEVVSHRGNVYRVKYIGKPKIFYLVTDGNGKWAHGATLKEAKADLVYKITDRDKSKYEGLTLDSELTFEEAVECYRIITGACAASTKNFVESVLGDKRKKKYTIREIVALTKGHYGAETFAGFFSR